jgi:hypothetical protein
MKNRTRTLIAAAGALLMVGTLSACITESDADVSSRNISKAAEQFEVQRRIVGVNGITDKYAFEVEGRCSIENVSNELQVTCKHGPDDFRKHVVGLSDNVFYVSTQLEGIDVDEYRTRIIIKPESLIPDLDLETSGDLENDGK